MTLEQADMLEAWLLTLPQVECASVHERTRCAVIEYQGDRKDLLRILAGFSYQDHALAELVPVHSSRALNRAYEEKLVGTLSLLCSGSLLLSLSIVQVLGGSLQYIVQFGRSGTLPTWQCFTGNVPVGHGDCSRHLISIVR